MAQNHQPRVRISSPTPQNFIWPFLTDPLLGGLLFDQKRKNVIFDPQKCAAIRILSKKPLKNLVSFLSNFCFGGFQKFQKIHGDQLF